MESLQQLFDNQKKEVLLWWHKTGHALSPKLVNGFTYFAFIFLLKIVWQIYKLFVEV